MQDLRKSGAPLNEIVQAGQWRSAAFMMYMDKPALDKACSAHASIDDAHTMRAFVLQETVFLVATQKEEIEERID